MSNCLVIGGGGFLGQALVRLLRERGDSVFVLARQRHPAVEALGAESLQGDITDPQATLDACRDRDLVFHTASKAGVWGPESEYQRINVQGTRNVLDACLKAGVPRLVYTSTPSVIYHPRTRIEGIDERLPYPERFECAYARTKAQAEKMVLEAHGQKGLCTVALRPHLIYGPGDPHLIPRVLQRAREGRLFQVGDGTNRVDLTFVDNAAQAHVLAGDRIQTAGGRAYFLSDGEPVALWPWIAGVLEAVGIPPVRRSLSFGMARALGCLMEGVHTLLRLPGEPRMTRFVASQLATSHWFDISAARRELGYEPQVSGAEGTRRLIEWIRGGGLERA